MVGQRKRRIRTPRYPRRWPWVFLAGLCLASAVGALLLLAYIRGHGAPKSGPPFFQDVLETMTNAGVALVLAFAALAIGCWSFRKIWTQWLAWHPGPIEVDTFASGSQLSDVDAAQLTMRFRQRLAKLRLRVPTPVPGTAAESDFLEVLGRNGLDSKNILGSVLNVVRAAKPHHAWQINGVLVERDEYPRYGVTVQVIKLPNDATPPDTVWGRGWDEAVRCAADRATAAILPRTRLCRTPWATWHRFVMPGEMVEAYEDAVELEFHRRYDEALSAYYLASSRDPSNLALRLHIGQLQEKMGLYLDAFGAYQGIVEIEKESSKPRRLRYRLAAHRERRRAALVAQYRRDVLLGGSELADQWRKPAPIDRTEWNEREKRRENLRDRLRDGLIDLETVAGYTEETAGALLALEPYDQAKHPLPTYLAKEEQTLLELRKAFADAALKDLKSVGRRAWRSRRDGRVVLSHESVQLTRLCVEQRLDFVRHQLDPPGSEPWKPKQECLERKVRKAEGSGFDRWQENYNAACAFAIPLMVNTAAESDPPPPWRASLAEQAVERLTQAAACSDSGYLAGRRAWLLSEDPDLDGLRREPRFKWFEAMYFPAAAPTPDRPRHVQTLEISRYIRDLLVQTGKRWESAWHERGRNLDGRPDVHTLLEWWNDERRAWALVRDIAINHRHWAARLKLIEKMRTWSDKHGFDPLDASFGRYEDEPLPGDPEDARLETDAADALLRSMRDLLPGANGYPPGPPPGEIPKWQSHLRRLDANGKSPPQIIIGVLCDEHAALWQRFGEWLMAESPEEEQEQRDAFKDQMNEARRWWSRADQWWRSPRLCVAVVRRAMPSRRGEPVAG